MEEYNTRMWSLETGNQQRKRWAIERQVRRTCFGIPGYIDEWVDHAYYETEAEAQKDLNRLNSFSDPMAHENYKIVDRSNERWQVRYAQ